MSSNGHNGSKPIVEVYDTTLRDGTQMEGMSLSCEDKLRIAEHLDTLGVDGRKQSRSRYGAKRP